MLQHYLQLFTRLNKQGVLSYASKFVRGLNVRAFQLTDGLLRQGNNRWLKGSTDLEVPFEQSQSPSFHEGGGKVHMFYWVVAFLTISFRDEIFFLCKSNLLDSTSVVKTNADFSKMKKIKPIVSSYTGQLSRHNVNILITGKQLLSASNEDCQIAAGVCHDAIVLSEAEKHVLERLARFSTASYGWRTLVSYGLGSWRMRCSNKKAVEMLMNVASQDIKAMENKSELYRPGYFIAVDHETRSIVVTVRGTTRLQDCITGITCTNVPLVLRTDDGDIVSGVVHEGFYHSAGYLNSSILPKVVEAMKQYPTYDIVTTGHSMGGACAALITLLWSQLPEFEGKHKQLKSISFGSPGVVCSTLANSTFVKNKVSAYVLGNDVVPRLSLATFDEFMRKCEELGQQDLDAHKRDLIVRSTHVAAKLYPCGLCFHIPATLMEEPKNSSPSHLREIDQTISLDSIQLGSSMLAAHLPVNYMRAIALQDTCERT